MIPRWYWYFLSKSTMRNLITVVFLFFIRTLILKIYVNLKFISCKRNFIFYFFLSGESDGEVIFMCIEHYNRFCTTYMQLLVWKCFRVMSKVMAMSISITFHISSACVETINSMVQSSPVSIIVRRISTTLLKLIWSCSI